MMVLTLDGVYGKISMNDILQLQTRYNNPNNWRDNIPPKQGYHNQHEQTLNNKDLHHQFKPVKHPQIKIYTVIYYLAIDWLWLESLDLRRLFATEQGF